MVEQIAVLNDTQSFEAIFHLYQKKLYRFANAIVKDAQAAEEVVSDVFVNIWRNRARLLEIENLHSYLYVSTKNIAIRYNMSMNRGAQLRIDEIEIEPDFPVKTPEDILLNNELMNRYEAAVRELPPKCQTIYRLAKQHGLRYKEIAAILNVSVKTIDAQLSIAIKRITQAVKFMYKAG
ncbi:MAG: RNA polymerase sigma-70 factor [Agriterribacter sp.]